MDSERAEDVAARPTSAEPGEWRARLWTFLAAQSISSAGSQVTAVALPVIAVFLLHAGPVAASALYASAYLPGALLGPFVGALIDRWPLRPVLVGCDIIRAAVLTAIPIASASGHLSLALLFTVAAVVGLFSVGFDSAAAAYIPLVVPESSYGSANSLSSISSSVGQLAGPSVGGFLIQAAGASRALLVDAASYLCSAALLFGGSPHKPPAPAGRLTAGGLISDAADGYRYVRSDPVLPGLIVGTAVLNLGGSAIGSLFAIYAYRDIGLSVGQYGTTLSVFSAGALLGGIGFPRLHKHIRLTRICLLASAATAAALFLIPLAQLGAGFLLLLAYQVSFALAATIWAIAGATLRQLRTPQVMLGRVSALNRTISVGALPLGAGLAAVLSSVFGVSTSILVTCILAALAPLVYARRSFRTAADSLSGGRIA